MDESIYKIIAYIKRLEALEAGIKEFKKYCVDTCASRNCSGYKSYGRRCPECPLEWKDELEARIPGADAMDRKWILHKEQKPMPRQKVFYYFEVTGVHRGRYYPPQTYAGKSGFLTEDVTHWMPDDGGDLPEPPKD